MVSTQYRCQNERRRTEVRKRRDADGLPILNGIDYLEVGADRKTLFVTFIHPLASALAVENLQLYRQQGKQRIELAIHSSSQAGKQLTLGITPPPERIPYTLQLVADLGTNDVPAGFDSQLVEVEFRLDLPERDEFGSEFDCQTAPAPMQPLKLPPAIDYLAKDYASFRQVMLDRLAVTLPQWTERSAADLNVMLVELVAYTADSLSYFQDAIATEAYLGTARKRVSVRRHARLLYYFIHDGCNARTWITLSVNQPVTLPEPQTQPIRFLTRVPGLPAVLSDVEFERAINQGAIVFEAMEAIALDPACNEIQFYTWSNLACVLPAGTTSAFLVDRLEKLKGILKPGRILLLEEIKGAKNGEPADADPAHRHVVRLTQVESLRDPLEDLYLLRIKWDQADALPFPLTLSQLVEDRPVEDIAVARGNVLLGDHGYTIDTEPQIHWLSPNRARLQEEPLTQQARSPLQHPADARVSQAFGANWRQRWGDQPPFDPLQAAAAALQWKLHHAMPAILLEETDASTGRTNTWYPRRDLLSSNRTARDFAVETEDDGRAYLRFGDGELGRSPQADAIYRPNYRIGNGAAGNIGAESIAHLYAGQLLVDLVEPDKQPIRNPNAASGGTDPEPIEDIRLYAPQAFRRLQRAVTEADYAEIVQRFPGVSKALATRKWTGSWYSIFITVDRQGGLPVDPLFQQAIVQFLEPFRLAGQDVKIEGPSLIPLDLALQVFVKSGYFQSQVKQALLEVLSDRVLDDSRLGFFHSDNFTFGQPVYLSQVIETVMQVAGVESMIPIRFQRWGLPPMGEKEAGRITLERLEIALLSTYNPPRQGNLELIMEGGL